MALRAGQLRFHALLAGAAVLTLASALTIGLTIWWLHSDAIADASRDTDNLATVLAHQIDNSVQSIDLVLTEIRDREEDRSVQAANDIDRTLRSEDTYRFLMERLSRVRQAEFMGWWTRMEALPARRDNGRRQKSTFPIAPIFSISRTTTIEASTSASSLFDRVKGLHVIILSKRINGAEQHISRHGRWPVSGSLISSKSMNPSHPCPISRFYYCIATARSSCVIPTRKTGCTRRCRPASPWYHWSRKAAANIDRRAISMANRVWSLCIRCATIRWWSISV